MNSYSYGENSYLNSANKRDLFIKIAHQLFYANILHVSYVTFHSINSMFDPQNRIEISIINVHLISGNVTQNSKNK